MRKFITPAILTLFVLAMPLMALAQAAAPSPDEGLNLVPMIVEAARGGHWSVFASLLIMVIVWGLTKAPVLSDLIKGEAKLWVAVVCGVCVAVAGEAFSTGDWLQAVLHGIGSGAAAAGFWEMVGKKIQGQPIVAAQAAAKAAMLVLVAGLGLSVAGCAGTQAPQVVRSVDVVIHSACQDVKELCSQYGRDQACNIVDDICMLEAVAAPVVEGAVGSADAGASAQ